MEPFALSKLHLTQYLFFTGKGGVGKTSTACAVATSLADSGNRVLLVSTDPASNLQDVFAMELHSKPTPITEVPGLSAANLDPIEAAAEYRESVIAPYRGFCRMRQSPTWKNSFPAPAPSRLQPLTHLPISSRMKPSKKATITSSSTRPPQGTRCGCCSYRPHGVISSTRAPMVPPALGSCPVWKKRKPSIKRQLIPWQIAARPCCF